MRNFKKWNDLQQFHEVVKNLNYPRIHNALKAHDYKINYGLKVKLHGTNACVRVETDGKVVAQKRSSDVTPLKDNAGFATWVASREDYFMKLASCDLVTYIYGEWCGPGIQDNVACSQTKNKVFYVFAIDYYKDDEFHMRVYDPTIIEDALLEWCPDDIVVIPWHSEVEVSFIKKVETQKALSAINGMVEKIGERDPLIYDLFEIEGCGEGVVAFPKMGDIGGLYKAEERDFFSYFNFKAKSEAHRVNKQKTAVAFDPQKFASVQLFADSYCTEARFEQAFNEAVSRKRDLRLIPDFISWVVKDIFKESATEREASPDLDWKAISKACSSRAVTWYKAKVEELV